MSKGFGKTIRSLDAKAKSGADSKQVAVALTKALKDPTFGEGLKAAMASNGGTEPLKMLASNAEETPVKVEPSDNKEEKKPPDEKKPEPSADDKDGKDEDEVDGGVIPDENPATKSVGDDSSADMAELTRKALEIVSSTVVGPLQDKANDLEQRLTSALSALEDARAEAANKDKKLKESSDAQAVLSDLSKMVGHQFGLNSSNEKPKRGNGDMTRGSTAFNKHTSIDSDEPVGIVSDCLDILSSTVVGSRMNASGRMEYMNNTHELDEFVRENRKQITKDLGKTFSNNGLLAGPSGGGNQFLSANTTAADVVGGFLPVLSSMMRDNNRAGYIFHQFMTTRINFVQGQGGSIAVPRAAFQPGPTTPSDRQLSGRGTYSSISSESQALLTGTVPINIEEWGLGKDGTAPPIGLPVFVQSYSMIDLMSILDRNLWQDYIRWEDLKARSLWMPTSRVIYNANDMPTTDPDDVVADSDGTCNHLFLQALSDYMYELEIPPLSDGCYGYAAPVRHMTTMRKALDEKLEAPSAEAVENITNILHTSTGGFVDRVTGYQGKIGNMHVFSSNGWGKGAAGSDGVQAVNLGGAGTPTNTYSAYAFGSDTVGRGIGREFNIRIDEMADFGRLNRVIWQEESGWAAFDVDPVGYSDASTVPQQLRVLEVRCTGEAQ